MFNNFIKSIVITIKVNGVLTCRRSETVLAFDYKTIIKPLHVHCPSPSRCRLELSQPGRLRQVPFRRVARRAYSASPRIPQRPAP